jgi:hypothetical protein
MNGNVINAGISAVFVNTDIFIGGFDAGVHCANISGNSLLGDNELSVDNGGAFMGVTQTDAANLSAVNNGATIVQFAVNYNVAACPLPSGPYT